MAKKPIDVYREWLGIEEPERPVNYYRLLGLKLFEDDVGKIRSQYRKLNAHVRKYASGDYAFESQELLNELAKAMLCLTDAQRKREYDAVLGRKDVGEGRRRTLEEILLAEKVLTPEDLERARRFAKAVGLEIRDAVVQQKLAPPDVVIQAYAESEGMPYIDLEETAVDESLVRQVPPAFARQNSVIPVMIDDNQVLVASPFPINPDVEEQLRLRFGVAVRTLLTTPAGMNAAVARYYSQAQQAAAVKASVQAERAARAAAPAPGSQDPASVTRQAIQFGILAFNMAVIFAMLVQMALWGASDPRKVVGMIVVSVIVGTGAGIGTFYYCYRKG
ncbi:MAG: hypothetical protein ACUVQK_07485 [Thermogutta sp.]